MAIPLLAALLGASSIKTGDKAPDFTLTRMLEKGPAILFFFPKAFTSG